MTLRRECDSTDGDTVLFYFFCIYFPLFICLSFLCSEWSAWAIKLNSGKQLLFSAQPTCVLTGKRLGCCKKILFQNSLSFCSHLLIQGKDLVFEKHIVRVNIRKMIFFLQTSNLEYFLLSFRTCSIWQLVPYIYTFSSVQFSSITQSCLTLCNPMNCSTPGLPVHHQLPEFTQTHVHWVGDAIQPSHPLSSPSPPAPNPSQHQSLFQWVNSSHEVAKVLEFQL